MSNADHAKFMRRAIELSALAGLDYGTGGPKQIENLYTRAILEKEFGDFCELKIEEEELEIHEGTSHGGMSAVVNLTGTKP